MTHHLRVMITAYIVRTAVVPTVDPWLLPISQLSIHPRQNSYSLDSKSSLTRYTTPHLTPPTLLATLDSSSINILPSPTKFQPSPKLAITVSDSFSCISPYLNSNTARTIATSIVHSKLGYCNSLYHNLPKSQITRYPLRP